jgi:hypothetical protein
MRYKKDFSNTSKLFLPKLLIKQEVKIRLRHEARKEGK